MVKGANEDSGTKKDGDVSQCPVKGVSSGSLSALFGYGRAMQLQQEKIKENTKGNQSQEGSTAKMEHQVPYGQNKLPGQKIDLSTVRTVSSIPKSDYTPIHQKEIDSKNTEIGYPSKTATLEKEELTTESEVAKHNWVYPSPQQYFNAMKRKGYNPKEEDVDVILAIHNLVNEQGWEQVVQWEEKYNNQQRETLKLKHFQGRPTDLSPKAMFLHYILGKEKPFDRHDWVVERKDGTEARYVLDFYGQLAPSVEEHLGKKGNNKAPATSNIQQHIDQHINSKPSGKPIVYIDCRPAIDSLDALAIRFKVGFDNIKKAWDTQNKSNNNEKKNRNDTAKNGIEDRPIR